MNHSECPHSCPICAGIEAFKSVPPEAKEHLASAAREAVMALRAILEAVAESSGNEETGFSKQSRPVAVPDEIEVATEKEA